MRGRLRLCLSARGRSDEEPVGELACSLSLVRFELGRLGWLKDCS
eukprot:COSAG02_NODE_47367_length_341_cov_1.504132_1_plen_44_part_01